MHTVFVPVKRKISCNFVGVRSFFVVVVIPSSGQHIYTLNDINNKYGMTLVWREQVFRFLLCHSLNWSFSSRESYKSIVQSNLSSIRHFTKVSFFSFSLSLASHCFFDMLSVFMVWILDCLMSIPIIIWKFIAGITHTHTHLKKRISKLYKNFSAYETNREHHNSLMAYCANEMSKSWVILKSSLKNRKTPIA